MKDEMYRQVYKVCPARQCADSAIETGFPAGCRMGMRRKPNFGRPTVRSLAGQSIVIFYLKSFVSTYFVDITIDFFFI